MLTRRLPQLDAIEQVKSLLKGVAGGETISVPSIVVVGAQSSGKSSVLEHATGLAFPRGEGMCTRVPTIVSVEGGADAESLTVSTDAEYNVHESTFEVDPDDSAAFGKAIETLTNTLTKTGEIGNTPIYVKYKRPTGLTFALTDVPGITCNSKHADGAVVERQTIELTEEMIGRSAYTLVLVVLPATEDFENSKALQLAKKLDPEGDRTIGVVTKIDNLPPGSEIVKQMSGDSLPLRHGYFAVRNRSQMEINEGMGLDELTRKETELFATDAVLKHLPEEQRGMARLLDKVASEQSKRLDERIPPMRSEIQCLIRKDSEALAGLPLPMADDAARLQFLNRKLSHIQADFRRCVESDTDVLGVARKETNLAARVHEVMATMEENTREKPPTFKEDHVTDQLRHANKEGLGYNLSNFMQGSVFRSVFREAVGPVLKEEAAVAVTATRKAVEACFCALVDHHLGNGVTPAIRSALKHLFCEMLDDVTSKTAQIVECLQRAEASVTHTTNHYYMQTIQKFEEKVNEEAHNWRNGSKLRNMGNEQFGLDEEFMHNTALSFHKGSNDALAVHTMQVSLHAYSKVVQKRFSDSVAVLLLGQVVQGSADTLTDEVINWAAALQCKVQEDPGVARKRQVLTNDLQRLEKALAVLKEL